MVGIFLFFTSFPLPPLPPPSLLPPSLPCSLFLFICCSLCLSSSCALSPMLSRKLDFLSVCTLLLSGVVIWGRREAAVRPHGILPVVSQGGIEIEPTYQTLAPFWPMCTFQPLKSGHLTNQDTVFCPKGVLIRETPLTVSSKSS